VNEATSCPVPDNESERLRAVSSYEILDTAPELDFDALTRVAAHAFQTPIAVVGLVDASRLWFKSKIGLDIPHLDRKVAFCSHAILKPQQPLVIPDLAEDPRFRHNPLVAKNPLLRFYAGSPIVDDQGLPLGTLAVLDTSPRDFTESQTEALRDMSALAFAAIRARSRYIEMQRLSLTDYVTGIPNRASFDRELVRHFTTAARTDEPFCLITLDLNGFKQVNDTYGHVAGDEVLREVARRISSLVRVSERFFRLGGDEFAILMPRADRVAAATLSQRVTESFQRNITMVSGHRVRVSVALGVAQYAGDISSPEAMLALSDDDLYKAKRLVQPQT
jgi:diguanylate cyclase (GGDEF)-like protein